MALLICSSILADIWMFSKLTNISFNRNYRYIIILLIHLIYTFSVDLTIDSITVGNIIELLMFIGLFYRYNIRLISGAVLSILILDLLIDIVMNVLVSMVIGNFLQIYAVVLNSILLIIVIYLWKKYANILRNQLTNEHGSILIGLLVYMYISLELIVTIYSHTSKNPTVWIYFSIVLLFQIAFSIWLYVALVKVQNQLISRQQQRERELEQKRLEEYASYLEESEDNLRAFRHDYRNILNSLKVSAQEGNVDEVIAKLDKYTATNLDSQALLKYKDVNHVQIKSVKSIIITKLAEMYKLGIPYNFECQNDVTQLPDNIDELDLVRIIGITFDNAIEESKALIQESHDSNAAEVQIMVYSSAPGEFEFEIQNRLRSNQSISTTEIQEKGFTTKKNHKGYGLANVREFEAKYSNMSVSYTIRDDKFDFYLVIDIEDGDEDNE